MPLLSSTQPDFNWLIRDNSIRQSGTIPSYDNYSPNIEIFQTLGVTEAGNSYQGQAVNVTNGNYHTPRRDFFIIYDNGNSLIATHEYNDDQLIGIQHYIHGQNTNPKIQFAYVTYAYEDDDPNAFAMSIIGDPCLTPSPSDIHCLSSIPTPSDKIVHQDILDGDDLTFIIKPNTQKIRISLANGNDLAGIQFSPQPFIIGTTENGVSYQNQAPVYFLSESPIFDYTQAPLSLSLSFSPSNFKAYLNYNVSVGEALIGNQLLIERIVTRDGNPDTTSQNVMVNSQYHDPNYIKVKCIWEGSDGNYWVRYRVYCYNEDDGIVPSVVNMHMTMPTSIAMNSISLDSFDIGCNKDCGRPICKKSEGNKLTIEFPSDPYIPSDPNVSSYTVLPGSDTPVLNAFNENDLMNCEHSAWVEFCARVELPTGTTIHNVDLQPKNPKTQFNDEYYPITDFFDNKICVRDTLVPGLSYSGEPTRLKVCKRYARVISEECVPCNCCQTWICCIWRRIVSIFS